MSDPGDIALFGLMKARLSMLSQRQKVVAENVANVSTPGFTPSDVDQSEFAQTLARVAGKGTGPGQVKMAVTQAGHMSAPTAGMTGGVHMKHMPDSETTLDGNSVVVEEQMMKIAETRMEFETMTGLYQKSLGLLRMASRSPSR